MFLGFQPVEAKGINDYIKEAPWIGLIADEVDYGPITITDVRIHHGNKLAFVQPKETLHGSLEYRINADDLKSMRLYHLVIGIKGVGPQDCVTHSMGVLDSHGTGKFELKAPKKPGIYQVRFMLSKGVTCASAREDWTTGQKEPSSNATIGVIIVE